MTTQKIEAVFQNGTFRPINPANLIIEEGQRVKIVVESDELPSVLQLATQVYDGLTPEEINEVENIALDRREFFGTKAQ